MTQSLPDARHYAPTPPLDAHRPARLLPAIQIVPEPLKFDEDLLERDDFWQLRARRRQIKDTGPQLRRITDLELRVRGD
jgi:hypothetical protein